MSAAPGAPGLSPTWCSSAKDVVGCALGSSRLWFTIGGGIINEVYYPRVDIPQIRDLGFLVGDGAGFWVEVKRLWNYLLELAAPGAPAVRIAHRHERFELVLRVTPCEHRDVLLIEVSLTGDEALKPYALLAPHLGGTGANNRAQVVSYRGRRLLWAEQGPFALALAAVTAQQQEAFGRASAGYVGSSDGWQDFARNGGLTWQYDSAGPGNVALIGELPRQAVLALGFGSSAESAATLALTALSEPFTVSWERQLIAWTRWHSQCGHEVLCTELTAECAEQVRISTMVLRVHQDKTYPGAMVASLSVPWGNTREERPGYHLVWPRDLVESAGALLAVGALRETRNLLRYLLATQYADGHWSQNQWLGGKAYWEGLQLDETAFPVLLAVALDERNALEGTEVRDMICRALSYLARQGPVSEQDRWEENAGLNTFTLAVCISALVAGARYLPAEGCKLALAIADYWNARLESWTSVGEDTPLARLYGVQGYYVRVAPEQTLSAERPEGVLPIRNLQKDPSLPVGAQVGVDFLQLVRFGLRRPDDPLILATVKVVDALLKVDTPAGPVWHRYNEDGYGEHDDGSAYDGTGRGRGWPLLTGERGHYELCRGRDPLPFLVTMTRMASAGGMLPEQVWDAAPLPARGLAPGRPSGAAMPLVWAHAEYLKLAASRRLQRPFDRPASVWERYRGERPPLTRVIWAEQAAVSELPEGCALTIALREPGAVRWGLDGWQDVREQDTVANPLGLYVLEIDTQRLRAGRHIDLTYRLGTRWIGRDFRVQVMPRTPQSG
ncbi:MAG TPA: glycoside hydrolase family 15 protein [Steroidobacteraceae bacterium]|jgi:glucoamylase|nr:glycoside hydrolase family 15 protein [Steroidobacteraceae bacterium]